MADVNTQYTPQDLIDAAIAQQPETFRNAFDQLMAPKILDRINALHKEVAASMFNAPSQE
jgi:hypothetical protein